MGRNTPLILATIVGIIAAGLTYSYLKSQQQITQQLKAVVIRQKQEMNRLQSQIQQLSRRNLVKRKVPVVVAKRDLKAGEILTSDMLEEKYIPAEAKIPAAAGSIDAVIGKQLLVDVVKGEQIILSRLVSPKVLQRQLIPPGKRLVTIEVEQTDLFRFIRPGDRVDIAVVLTLPGPYVVSAGLFSDVEIKAINGRISYNIPPPAQEKEAIRRRDKSSSSGGIKLNPHKGTLTFALSLRDAALLNMAAKFGKIEIYPRSRVDPIKEKIPPVSLDTVLQSALPNLVARMNLLKKQNLEQQKEESKSTGLPKVVEPSVKQVRKIRIRKGNQVEIREIGNNLQGKEGKGAQQLLYSRDTQKEGMSLIERGIPYPDESDSNFNNEGLKQKRKRKESFSSKTPREEERIKEKDSEVKEDPFKDKFPPSLDRYLRSAR